MKTIKTLLIILFLPSYLFCQTPYENLRKYWYYRERLKNFVYVSPNYTEAGTNYPAERISPTKDYLVWDDGNGAFNNYISVLATEYRLLKNFGHEEEYKQTAKELFYALKSFERLDLTAEHIIHPEHAQVEGDLNGYFVRKDVDTNFWNKYKKGGTYNDTGYFKQPYADFGDKQQNSWDNCVHLIESFALINALVDNEVVDGIEINFKQLAKDNTRRIIQNMQHQDDPIPVLSLLGNLYTYKWYLTDPVTGNPIPKEYGSGLDGTMLYGSYGLAKAANQILGENAFNEMNLSYEITKIILTYTLTELKLAGSAQVKIGILPPTPPYTDYVISLTAPGGLDITLLDLINFPGIKAKLLSTTIASIDIPIDDYKARSLCATGNVDIVKDLSPYEVLIKKQHESSVYKYEHFPLIWSVVNDNFGYIKEEDRTFIKNLLNEAPTCGPYKIEVGGELQYASRLWSSQNRIVWPENIAEYSHDNLGYYSGLDYMLLHNLYWLSNKEYPENINFRQYLMGLLPLRAIATNNVTCSTEVKSTLGQVVFVAGNKISLYPGFKVSPNSLYGFKARCSNAMYEGEDPLFFEKVSLDDYPTCPSLNYSRLKSSETISNISLNTEERGKFNIYPNPCNDEITIENSLKREIGRVEFYNTTGTLIKTYMSSVSHQKINISDLSSGIYFLKIYDKENNISNSKIIKQ